MSRHSAFLTSIAAIVLAGPTPLFAQALSPPPVAIETGGHIGHVLDVEFSPDGTRFFTVGNDLALRMWDSRTGRSLQTWYPAFDEQTRLVALAVSPDGGQLAVSGLAALRGPTIYILSLARGRIEKALRGHEAPISALQFDVGGGQLVSADTAGNVWCWDNRLTEPSHRLKAEASVAALALSPKSLRIAAAALDGSTIVWDLKTGERLLRTSRGNAPCLSVAFSPDGTLASCAGTKIRLFGQEGQPTGEVDLQGQPPYLIRYVSENELVFGGTGLGRVHIQSGEKQIFAQETTTAIAVAPQSGVIAAAKFNADVALWTVKGQPLPVGGSRAQPVKRVRWLGPSKFAWQTADKAAQAFDLASVSFTANARGMEFEPPAHRRGSVSLTKAVGDQAVQVLRDGKPILQLKLDGAMGRVTCFTLIDERRAAVGSNLGRLHLFDLRGGRELRVLEGHKAAINDMASSPDGAYLLTGSDDRTLRIWHMDDLALGLDPGLLLSLVEAGGEWAAWTPEGFYAASAGGERFVAWKLATEQDQLLRPAFLKQFQSRLFRPQLIAGLLDAKSVFSAIEAVGPLNLWKTTMCDVRLAADLKTLLPPTIEWLEPSGGSISTDSERVRVQVRVTSASGTPVSKVLFLVNGRTQKVRHDSQRQWTIDEEINVLPGYNQVAVIAIDDQNIFEQSTTLNVFRGSKDVFLTSASAGGRQEHFHDLYVVAVGISTYQQPNLNLNFAHLDAQGMEQALKKQAAKPYAQVYSKTLCNEQASRGEILDALQWAVDCAQLEDTVILAFSAHGIRDETANYYLAPYDTDVAHIRRSCLGWHEIVKVVQDLRANKVIVMMDTCHAGGVVGAKSLEKDPLRDLTGEQVGAVVYASSALDKRSFENAVWQHGAFTKSFLDAIIDPNSDKDDPRDEFLSVTEIDFNLNRRVRQLTNEGQVPVIQRPATLTDFNVLQINR